MSVSTHILPSFAYPRESKCSYLCEMKYFKGGFCIPIISETALLWSYYTIIQCDFTLSLLGIGFCCSCRIYFLPHTRYSLREAKIMIIWNEMEFWNKKKQKRFIFMGRHKSEWVIKEHSDIPFLIFSSSFFLLFSTLNLIHLQSFEKCSLVFHKIQQKIFMSAARFGYWLHMMQSWFSLVKEGQMIGIVE